MLSSFSLPSSPYSGKQGLLLDSFSIELTVQCDRCLIWGLGWQAGLVAGLRVGQAYGVFHQPGFGLLGSVPRPLSTQPPFATQALTTLNFTISHHEQECMLTCLLHILPDFNTTVFTNYVNSHI